MSVVHGLGFPGSSSQRNGTEAETCNGGVDVPDLSGDCMCACGAENSGNFGV